MAWSSHSLWQSYSKQSLYLTDTEKQKEKINLQESEVTIKGLMGKYLTFPVKDQTFLEDMEIGEIGSMSNGRSSRHII
jgi:hypothetical protein